MDEGTDPWGVKVERVEMKDIRLPDQLMRAMAAEAEAAREAKAKVIAAEGEHKSSRFYKEAADILSQNPASVQLRYLQTLNGIANDNNQTIIFPLPLELVRKFAKHLDARSSTSSTPFSSTSTYETAHSGSTYETAQSHLSE